MSMDDIIAAIESKQYSRVTSKCRECEADILANNPTSAFYSIYILGHLLQNELPIARAVYLRTPPHIQETPTIKFIFSLLQRVWNRDYKGFYTVISQVETGLVQLDAEIRALVMEYKLYWQSRTLDLLTKAYASIRPEKAAEYLGLPNDVIVPVLQEDGWTYDAETALLHTPKRNQERMETIHETDFSDFERLAKIAMVLKGR